MLKFLQSRKFVIITTERPYAPVHCQVGLFCLSVTTWAITGPLSGWYFTNWPPEFKSLLELKSSPTLLTQRCTKYLTKLIFSVCTIRYGTSFYSPPPWAINWNLVSKRYLYHEKKFDNFWSEGLF